METVAALDHFELKDAATRHRAFDLSLKAKPDAAGRFAGYASVWGVTDVYREQVAKGAFAESIAETAAKGRTLPILWQHRSDEPIGQWDKLQEDSHGLYGEGTLWLADAAYARLAQRGMAAGCITGLSIGYYVRDASYDEVTRLRTLKQVDLVEVSVVTNPANDEARIDSIKAKLAAGETVTEREFRRVLRERGWSHSQAEDIANLGFKEWSRRETGTRTANPSGISDLAKALAGFSLPKL